MYDLYESSVFTNLMAHSKPQLADFIKFDPKSVMKLQNLEKGQENIFSLAIPIA